MTEKYKVDPHILQNTFMYTVQRFHHWKDNPDAVLEEDTLGS